ncbi:uncharacterized protein LOC111352582 [Spodoptera litura]|uniref:Uncharacterized protein LOC111352582 n=1 Tax=Spodoptera litura TaxID=69820 RepID=A0A9J7IQ09_SPOLT|nr:uncharacterized protein LOC111352582 [Spodoptera litura]
MPKCPDYDPDKVFQRFKVLEFPPSFVGLSTTQLLDVEVDLNKSAYLKTKCEGRLVKFDDARQLSANHRAYNLELENETTIKVTFEPKNDCIAKAKHTLQLGNRFVFDLRLIQVDAVRCCNLEDHSEIGRYYISGHYEICKISHSPKVVNFGDIAMNNKVTRHLRIRNESKLIAAKMWIERLTCFEFHPMKFTIPPNSSIKITISVKPASFNIAKSFTFKIRNPHDELFDINCETSSPDENYITYRINNHSNILFPKPPKVVIAESLHKLNEQNPCYTYMNEELEIHNERKYKADKHIDCCRPKGPKQKVVEKHITGRDHCNSDILSKIQKLDKNFCKKKVPKISAYELFHILFVPNYIDFGKVATLTYGESEITIKNKTKYAITVKMLPDDCILYTINRCPEIVMRLKPYNDANLVVFCQGLTTGIHKSTVNYIIDGVYAGKHPYTMEVGNPVLTIPDECIKFGMVTTESFITSVPVRIYNNYNVAVNFQWAEIHPDTPFEILPVTGCVPSNSCKICTITYVSKPTKTKVHEVQLISDSITTEKIILELSVVTRKLSIKFLQQAVMFKDIPLNLEVEEKIKLENASREVAFFHVIEPLIPGVRIEPMSGTIRQKTIQTLIIIVKIPCVMEFALDLVVKINNKENVTLPVSGNVIEPKIMIHPKLLYMSRIPCYLVTYVPITFQNSGPVRSEVQVLDTGDDNMFNIYVAHGNEKQRITEFSLEAGHSKVVYIKVCDIFRREYEMYIPFKVNGLLGPPNDDTWSTEFHYYVGKFEHHYQHNPKLKLRTVNKDICYCRIAGVITLPWVEFSTQKFEIDYVPQGANAMDFSITNISKHLLNGTVITSKLAPIFTLHVIEQEDESVETEHCIKFILNPQKTIQFTLNFHPKAHGKFITTALLYLDKHMTIPYYNLTFTGKRENPIMIPSTYRIIFPPCHVGSEIYQIITINLAAESDLDAFRSSLDDETNLKITFIDHNIDEDNEEIHTTVTVKLEIKTETPYLGNFIVNFYHDSGSSCEVEINFCVTYCIITLHADDLVKPEDNPYPYYPLSDQTNLYDYLEKCSIFLEKWMFQQGFRRDLYPTIPDTFHALASAMIIQPATKTKGINSSYLNFVKRIAGPLMKHVRKIVAQCDEPFKQVKEVHDTYKEIINLLKSRGANLWVLQAKYLLSHEQFVIYCDNTEPKSHADMLLTQQLLSDVNLFNRLNKQSWIDFILQSYKVFVMDSCFFDCVCVTTIPRDIIGILLDWYNEQIMLKQQLLIGKNKPIKQIVNLTTDLSDGIALASAITHFCPFLTDNFSAFCEIHEASREGDIINNACIIIEAINILRLYFPLSTEDFFEPNFIQMLFLSIHLFVILPTFKTKQVIHFRPPLLRSSSRQVAISPTSQESLTFSFILLNNTGNNFSVEKSAADNGKKMFLTVKYTANFVSDKNCILLVHGYNKTRIFDTYLVFMLYGQVGLLTPVRKCKVSGPLYRPVKVDVSASSPFLGPHLFQLYITDVEPSIPVNFEESYKPKFFIRRLNLIEKEVTLTGSPKEQGLELGDHKLYLQMACLSVQVGNTWIWFSSDVGQFFIKVTTQPRWDIPIDSLQTKVHTWPMDPCSCGEACECYRTTIVMIPHRVDLMLKAVRYALLEHASSTMIQIFDRLIDSATGKIVLTMLLEEGGTNMSDVNHILRSSSTFRITSRSLIPRIERVTMYHHTNAILALPVTLPAKNKPDKYSISLTSDCGLDIRTYRIFFVESTEFECPRE